MQLVRRLIYFVSAFVLVSGVALAVLHQSGSFEVTAIPIEVTSEDIVSRGTPGSSGEIRSRVAKALGRFSAKRIWEVDLGEMKAAVMRDKWVSDVRISRAFPNEIRVRVSPKSAVLVLVGPRGQMMPIAEDASLLGVLDPEHLPDAPLLRGEQFATDAARRERAVAFVMSLPEKGPLGRGNVSEVSWTHEEGYSLTLINPKVEVKLGEDRAALKVARVTQVLNYLSANQLKSRVIDASFSKKVLVRLRKAP